MRALPENRLLVLSLIVVLAVALYSTGTPAAADNPFQRMLAPLKEVNKGTSAVVSGVGSVSGVKSLQEKLTTLQGTLNRLDSQMSGTTNQLSKMDTSMAQVQQELRVMRGELQGLREPMQKLGGPLLKVATPLADVSIELKQLRALLQAVLMASIVIAIAAVAIIGLLLNYIVFGSKQWPIGFKNAPLLKVRVNEPEQEDQTRDSPLR